MKYIPKVITREDALTCVGNGWAGLVNEAYDLLAQYPTVKVLHVKEKYGGLRIYTDLYDEAVDSFIIKLEERSFEVCEVCGQPGNLREGSWHQTLCEEHANGRKAIEPF